MHTLICFRVCVCAYARVCSSLSAHLPFSLSLSHCAVIVGYKSDLLSIVAHEMNLHDKVVLLYDFS